MRATKESQNPKNSGLTLVELLIAMAISGMVMAGIYTIYNSQVTSYTVQKQTTDMQQNLRATMYYMQNEIRAAGYDPGNAGAAGITNAISASLRFTANCQGGDTDGEDNDGDGLIDEPDEAQFGDDDLADPGEDVEYVLFDFGGDGDTDLGRTDFNSGAVPNLVAENIDALDFVYLGSIEMLSDGIDNDVDGAVDEAGENVLPFPINIPDIRTVQVTIVARSGRRDRSYVNTQVYLNQQGTIILPAPNDNFRRTVLSMEIQCRNLGV
ncbi:MAG: prepilin-type N-terminal cleavage/methylation domain-containing protein [Thermodesulfobacteriota bacterium]|nr:prepilin-type N-terminal cleavage/methylation domain-containing protein [Thermodesulfobacteriota bacterium]